MFIIAVGNCYTVKDIFCVSGWLVMVLTCLLYISREISLKLYIMYFCPKKLFLDAPMPEVGIGMSRHKLCHHLVCLNV